MTFTRKWFDKFTATQNISWNRYNIKVSKKDYSMGHLHKNVYFTKFYVLQPFRESWFSVLRRGFGKFTAAFITMQYCYNIKATQKKFTVRDIFKKMCNLGNFAFYNYSKNIGS